MVAALGGFAAGLLVGMWVGKHPDDSRAYGEAALVRVKKLFTAIRGKVTGVAGKGE